MDMIDKVIQRSREALHEQQRVAAVERRHRKERQTEAKVRLTQIEDRIAFHVPVRPRFSGESERDYEQYMQGVNLYRHCLMMKVVAAMQSPDEDLWGSDAPDAFMRGDF
jgi:hypothetical protein